MPFRCCVPNCKGNYDSSSEKVSVFKFPRDKNLSDKWLEAIRRENFQPTKQSRVCESHFYAKDIERQTSQYMSKTGETVTVKLRFPRLRTGAVPSLFTDMGCKCCALGCKSNYFPKPYITCFRFPRDAEKRKLWIEKINRKDFNPSRTAVVCIKHFEEKFITREDHFKQADGSVWTVKRKRVILHPDAVPTLFENVPTAVLKRSRSDCKKPYKHRKQMKNSTDIEDASHALKECSCIDCIEEFDTPKFKLPLLTENKFSFTGQSGQAFEMDSNSSLAHKDSSASNDLNVRNKLSKPTSNDSMNGSSSYKVKIEEDSSTIPSDSVDLNNSVCDFSAMNRSEELLSSMTCERFPDSQSQILGIKIKQEPEDPVDIPSTNSQNKLTNCGQESQIMSSTESSLFQPPVLIKEEIVSEEEEL